MDQSSEQTRNRKALQRATREHQRDIARRELRAARDAVRAVRLERRALLKRVGQACRAAAVRGRAAVRARRAAALSALRTELANIRQAWKNRCQARRVGTRRAMDLKLSSKMRELAALRREQHRDRLLAGATRQHLQRHAARERAGESDEEVESNLPPELHQLWEAHKRGIRGRAGLSRTEAFKLWVHEHPEAVWETADTTSEKTMRASLLAHRKAERAHYIATKKPRRVALADVPF